MPQVWVQSRDLGFKAHGFAPQAQPCSHVLWGSHSVPYTTLCSTFLTSATAPGAAAQHSAAHTQPLLEGGERNADVLLLAPHLFNSSFSVCWRAPIPPFPGFAHVCPNAWVGFHLCWREVREMQMSCSLPHICSIPHFQCVGGPPSHLSQALPTCAPTLGSDSRGNAIIFRRRRMIGTAAGSTAMPTELPWPL